MTGGMGEVYRYDVHSRMRVEETNADIGEYTNINTVFYGCFPNDPGASGSCGGGNPGIIYAHEERADANDDWQRTVEYTIGAGITGSMSGSASNPWVATGLPGGSSNNKAVVLVELISYGSINVPTYVWQYRSENQQRSLLGTTNEFGDRRSEVDYNEYGQPYLKKILWDGGQYLDSVQQAENQVEITLSSLGSLTQPLTANMLGALARFTSAGSSPYVLFGRVTSVNLGSDYFVVEDPSGDIYTMLTTGTEDQITVFDHHDANIGSAVHTAGLWTSNPSPGSGQTTFTIGTSVMPTHIVGWTLQPDARYPVFYTVTAASSNTVSVAGDITGTLPDVTETDVFYMLIPPVGVDKTTGALSQDPLQPVTRYLAFQYHYQPPVAGTEIESTTYGRQTADNLVGGYYCWNRRYDSALGRWTTSDPLETPWSNLVDYCRGGTTKSTDPCGLARISADAAAVQWIDRAHGLPIADDSPPPARTSVNTLTALTSNDRARVVNYIHAWVETPDRFRVTAYDFHSDSMSHVAPAAVHYRDKQHKWRFWRGDVECAGFRQIGGGRTIRPQQIGAAAGGAIGAVGGGIAGGKLGAQIGIIGGPKGIAAGAVIGGLVGAGIGWFAAGQVFNYPPIWTMVEVTICADGTRSWNLIDHSWFPDVTFYWEGNGGGSFAKSKKWWKGNLKRWEAVGWGPWDGSINQSKPSENGNPWGA